jgi:hypothetical protein
LRQPQPPLLLTRWLRTGGNAAMGLSASPFGHFLGVNNAKLSNGPQISAPLSSASIHSPALAPKPLAGAFRFPSFACVITFTGSPFLQVFSFCSSCCRRRVSPQAKLSWVTRKAGKHLLTKVIRNALTDALAGLISLRFHLWRRAPVLHLARWLGALILY